MKDNSGGRADAWSGHPAGDRMSVADLKSVPGIIDRAPKAASGRGTHNPSSAEFDRIHTQDKTPIRRRPIG